MIKVKSKLDPVYKITAFKLEEYDNEDIVAYRLTNNCHDEIIYNRKLDKYVEVQTGRYIIARLAYGLCLMEKEKDKENGRFVGYKQTALNLETMQFSLAQTICNKLSLIKDDPSIMRSGLPFVPVHNIE